MENVAENYINTIKEYLLNEIEKDEDEIHVDVVSEDIHVDKKLVLKVMKDFEAEGRGVIIVGRRGGKTRFKVGIMKNQSPYAVALASVLEKVISQKEENITIETDSLLSKFDKKDIIAAFKILESKQLGRFVVGRKGGKSRFESGQQKIVKIYNTKKQNISTASDEDVLVVRVNDKASNDKYVIRAYANTTFAILSQNGVSFEEAFAAFEKEKLQGKGNVEQFKTNLFKFGIAKLNSLTEEK